MGGSMPDIGTRICQGEGSFLKEPLVPTSTTNTVTTYDLDMSIQDYYGGDFVYAVVANCKNLTNVEYDITFTNPGSFRRRHFSCQDVGLLELYTLVFIAYCVVLKLRVKPAYDRITLATPPPPEEGSLEQDKPIYEYRRALWWVPISLAFFASVSLQLAHLLVYSADGMGLKAFSYLGELMEVMGLCLLLAQLASSCKKTSTWPMGIAAYFVCFFLWTQMTYKNRYVQRLRSGEGLGDFGLSVYSPLFGTSVGIFTVLMRSAASVWLCMNELREIRKALEVGTMSYDFYRQRLQFVGACGLYLLMPLVLVASPIRWKHCEVLALTVTPLIPIALSFRATHPPDSEGASGLLKNQVTSQKPEAYETI